MTMSAKDSRTRALLEAKLAELHEDEGLGASDRATVTLDQQSVGRLSRMDAMQRQAMAAATHRRREVESQRLRAALARLAEGEYGYCQECGEAIAVGRLAHDPAAALCISCARG